MAGGVDKTCKSNADCRVAISCSRSGVRVRNTWVICREVGDNPEKSGLIPNVVVWVIFEQLKPGTVRPGAS